MTEKDPNTAAFSIPLILKATRAVLDEVNGKSTGAIRTSGFFANELMLAGATSTGVAQLLVAALGA